MATTRRSRGTRGSSRGSGTPSDTGSSGSTSTAAPRELVVITSADVGARATRRGLESDGGADVSAIAAAVAAPNVTLRPLFDLPEERIRARVAEVAAEAGTDVPDLSRFYQVEAPQAQLDDIAEQLREAPGIEAAYIKPPTELPQLNDMLPVPEDAPPATPDFTAQQGYLNPAPGGIDAKFAWTKAGGTGAGINIIDIEGAWRFTHEDLGINQGGLIHGVHSSDVNWRNHGTAVIGEFSGDKNSIGITGICADAKVRAASIFTSQIAASSSAAIMAAANLLSKGDILLLELHRPGPRFNFQQRNDQKGYIAIEWWPDDLAAIKFAVAKGIIVVEAAGNGAENLDDAIYNTRPAGFPNTWVNPFKRNPVDSGAIVVGAGAPPSGNFGADRSRLGFSNFGALVDAQGWGREVVTAAYGDLQGGANENLWYTKEFSGTSSASPIVVGAIGCLQGMVKAAAKPLLTPAQVRTHLRTTGSPQQNGPNGGASQRIGNRPDLKALYNKVLGVSKAPLKDINDNKIVKEFDKVQDVKVIEKGKDFEKTKDSKDLKEKELKEKELKENKDLKEKEFKESKELKEKDKELKEKDKDKDKELKEGKELKDKDKDKDLKEGKGFKEIEVLAPGTTGAAGGTTAQRISALEQAVQMLTHFIAAELRPDLASSSLAGESDQQNAEALSAQLQKQASDAKTMKDDKDVEKTRDL